MPEKCSPLKYVKSFISRSLPTNEPHEINFQLNLVLNLQLEGLQNRPCLKEECAMELRGNKQFQNLYFAGRKYCYKYFGSVSEILHQMPKLSIIVQKYELQVNTYLL